MFFMVQEFTCNIQMFLYCEFINALLGAVGAVLRTMNAVMMMITRKVFVTNMF